MNKYQHIPDEEFEEIEQFLLGKLSGSALADLEKKMADESDFQNKVMLVKATLTGIREAALEEELKKEVPGKAEAKIVDIRRRRRYVRISLLIAAASAIIVFVSLFMTGIFKSNDEKLFAQFYKPDSGLITSMGVADNYDFGVAMVNYKSGNYEEAIKAWETLRKENETNDTLNYFIGSAYLAIGNAGRSISCLKQVIAQPGSTFYGDAQWYLGLALLKEGKQDDAVSHIAGSNNEAKEKLLEKIKR